jgi:hypothetical protein
VQSLKSQIVGFVVARIVAIVLLVWALAKHPIGYFTILRFVTCAICCYAAYIASKSKNAAWAIAFGTVALLFNPLVSFRMTRQTWGYVDVIVAVFLAASIYWFRPYETQA